MRVSCRQHSPSPIDTEHASAKKNDILLHNHKRSSHSGNVILSQYYYPICHPLLRCPICPCNVLYGCVFTPSLSHPCPICYNIQFLKIKKKWYNCTLPKYLFLKYLFTEKTSNGIVLKKNLVTYIATGSKLWKGNIKKIFHRTHEQKGQR